MPFFKGSGGAIIEIDLPDPANGQAAELHAYKLASGELVEVAAELVEAYTDGPGVKLRLREGDTEPARRGRAPKNSDTPDPQE